VVTEIDSFQKRIYVSKTKIEFAVAVFFLTDEGAVSEPRC